MKKENENNRGDKRGSLDIIGTCTIPGTRDRRKQEPTPKSPDNFRKHGQGAGLKPGSKPRSKPLGSHRPIPSHSADPKNSTNITSKIPLTIERECFDEDNPQESKDHFDHQPDWVKALVKLTRKAREVQDT